MVQPPPPISSLDLGIVGNCQFNALIDRTGNVAWLCWPRFDSSFVFGGLLDDTQGGSFAVSPASGTIGRQSYRRNTNVLVTTFEDTAGSFEVIDFAPRFRVGERYYRPTTFVRILRPLAGRPMVQVTCAPQYQYGQQTLEAEAGDSFVRYLGAPAELRLSTDLPVEYIVESRPFVLSGDKHLILSYGAPPEEDAATLASKWLVETLAYWQRWVKHCHVPAEYQDEVLRAALVLKLHQYEDTGAVIAATTTSVPEAPGTQRNWDYRYCWLRDTLFSIAALQRLTHFEEMEAFVGFLENVVANAAGGRLQPVYGIGGEATLTENFLPYLKGFRGNGPVRIGNQAFEHHQHDVYGEMILAISPLFLDARFFDGRQEPPFALLSDLLGRINRHIEAEDAGLWEFRGSERLHTFTVLMHWAGAARAERIGHKHAKPELIESGAALKAHAAKLLEERCFDRDLGVYTQAAGLPHMDAALLMLINMGYLAGDDPRASAQIDAILATLNTPSGLIKRYAHADDFGATENSFTLCSFWLAEALARVGRVGEARRLFELLRSSGNHLGLFSEDLDPRTMTQWGNFPQTYSHVGLINAAFQLASNEGVYTL
jgi:GH15 family glucan-1,4-alpha-glucosidase